MKAYLTKTNLILTVSCLIILYFLWSVNDILLPFVLAFVLAYVLDPMVERLSRRRLSRGVAAGLVDGVFCLGVIAVCLLLVPIMQAQVISFMHHIPRFSASVWNSVKTVLTYAKDNIPQDQMLEMSDAVKGSVMNVLTAVGASFSRILSGGVAIFNILALILITPVVLFYVLKDWKQIQEHICNLIPKSKEKEMKSIGQEINRTLSGFIRGQALVCLSLGVFYGIGLSVVGLDFGILVGLLAGLLSFIPYFGFGTGLVLSLFLGLMQEFGWGQWLGLATVFVVGQILEGYVLTPRLVGNRVGLSPVWIIFALLAGGVLAGFVGILVAVPVAAVIGVLVRHGVAWYRKTSFYRGEARK